MDWDDFIPHVLPSARGCPDPLLLDHILKAARSFCARTLVWNYETQPIEAEADVDTYTLQLVEGQQLVRVLTLSVDGGDYEIPRGFVGRRMKRDGVTGIATFKNSLDFVLSPAPSEGQEILVDVAVKPAMTCPEWPDELEEHVPDIAHGAIASLCALPGYAWTNLDAAASSAALFRDRIGTVGAIVAKGYGRNRSHQSVEWL